MATPAVTYTFAANTLIKASEANTNFQDIVDFLTNEVIQKDASVAFTVTPAGPATDPTTDNQFTRKAYVDDADEARVKAVRVAQATLSGGNQNLAAAQIRFQGAEAEGTTDGSGFVRITFPEGFLNGCIAFVAMPSDYAQGNLVFSLGGVTQTYADVLVRHANTGAAAAATYVTFSFVALGW